MPHGEELEKLWNYPFCWYCISSNHAVFSSVQSTGVLPSGDQEYRAPGQGRPARDHQCREARSV